MKLLAQAILTGYRRLKDKSVNVNFNLNEIQNISDIDSLMDTFGILYFKDTERLTEAELEEIDKIDLDVYDNPKTQSQRLRNVLYKVWELEEIGEFKDFYKDETEKIIQHYKNKLDD